jgi:peptidylprolyl isomerase
MEQVDALPKGEPPRSPGKIVSMKVAADLDNAADLLPKD